ncbi:MAG: PLDc N-terminal domain-containing protein [Arcobacteraceae bacterium]|jgi:tetratricopeptide (TPR) repeat protein|nr:PLDc N-terminal domain-containing protein [Arcobacteraceae bacterium]
MSSILILYGFGFLIWLYAFYSVLVSEFKNSSNKIVWIIVLIFLPISAIVYLFIGKEQIVEKDHKIDFENFIQILAFIVAMMLASFLVGYIKNHYGITDDEHFGFIGRVIVVTIVGFIISLLFAMLYGIISAIWNRICATNFVLYLIGGVVIFVLLGTIFNVYVNNLEEEKVNKELAIKKFDSKEYDEAFKLLSDLNSEDPIVELYLGIAYTDGLGTIQNYFLAFKHLEISANQGNHLAQNLLGIQYLDGKGVEKDYQIALSLFEKSASQNNMQAMRNLGLMYYSGTGIPKDYKKAFDYFQNSANKGDMQAKFYLSILYMSGQGVEKNLERAAKLLVESASQGFKPAQDKINEIDSME